MQLTFNKQLAAGYKSKSQIIRVLSEDWVKQYGYCPNCGHKPLNEFSNNRPVADFHCTQCHEQFELKSKKAKLSQVVNTINDGAYTTMIDRINSDDNPNFFFLTYSKEYNINNFLIIPKHFFTPDIIIKRRPLSSSARRAGWVGCNIDLRQVPESGKVFLVKNQQAIKSSYVIKQFQRCKFLSQQTLISRGWTLNIMQCVDKLPNRFNLKDVYKFKDSLQLLHPNNNNIHAKIRQQLQILRDKGYIEFLGNGHYRKLN